MTPAPDAVLFDLDGTLIHTEPLCEAVLRDVCAELGLDLTPERYGTVVGRAWGSVFDELAQGQPPEARAWMQRETFARYQALVEAGTPTIPGGAEFIRSLAGHLHVAIVTGSSRAQLDLAIRQLGVGDVLGLSISEDDVTIGKPHPEGYLKAISAFGVSPARTVVFEDSTAGIAAGRAAGCRVVAVTSTNTYGNDQSGAHAFIPDHTGLDLAWLRGLFSS